MLWVEEKRLVGWPMPLRAHSGTLPIRVLRCKPAATGRYMDSVWEKEKSEAGIMLENDARHEAAVPTVQCTL
jgi:hypothetical protein